MSLDIKFIDVSYKNNDIILLRKFYSETYEEAFPKDDERETLSRLLQFLKMKKRGKYKCNNYHVILAVIDNEVIGGLICDYFDVSNSGFIEYIAVNKCFLRKGIGYSLAKEAERLLAIDASLNNKIVNYIFTEIEDVNSNSQRFFCKLGMKKADFEYIQPAIDEKKNPVKNLDLWVKECQEQKNSIPSISLTMFLYDYAGFSNWIKKPDEDPTVSKMVDQLLSIQSQSVNLTLESVE